MPARRTARFEYDPDAAIAALSKADRPMRRLIKHVGAFAMETRHIRSPFQSLLRAIVYQQLSGKAAASIHARVIELFPEGRVPRPQDLIELSDEQLRSAGLSRNKTVAVKDLAVKTLDKVVPSMQAMRRMEDEQIVERLVQVRGIGQWTVEMMLMFSLGRPDVLPATDLGVRKGFMFTYGLDELPKFDALRDHAESWRPYRSVASWYLWRAAEIDELPG